MDAPSVRAHYGGKRDGIVCDLTITREVAEAAGMGDIETLVGGLSDSHRATQRLISLASTRASELGWRLPAYVRFASS